MVVGAAEVVSEDSVVVGRPVVDALDVVVLDGTSVVSVVIGVVGA